MPNDQLTAPTLAGDAARIRWAGLSGRPHGRAGGPGRPIVFLHGLTFDHRMWGPVLDALPAGQEAIAFDLPGHGGSPMLESRGLAAVVDAVHEAVEEAGVDTPVMVGHSIGGPLAAIYAATYPAAAVVSIEAPIRLEAFADAIREAGPRLAGDGFAEAWSPIRDSLGMHLLPPAEQELLVECEQPSQGLVLAYQSDLLERPLADVAAWRDQGLARLRAAGTPFVVLQANPVDPAERAWLADRLPQAEVVVWNVGHHFPHLAAPTALARLVVGLASGGGGVERVHSGGELGLAGGQ
jgi:pimeloyl-ACP methyl ester carboxylesterase